MTNFQKPRTAKDSQGIGRTILGVVSASGDKIKYNFQWAFNIEKKTSPEALINKLEAAELLSVHPNTIMNLAKSGRIKIYSELIAEVTGLMLTYIKRIRI